MGVVLCTKGSFPNRQSWGVWSKGVKMSLEKADLDRLEERLNQKLVLLNEGHIKILSHLFVVRLVMFFGLTWVFVKFVWQ